VAPDTQETPSRLLLTGAALLALEGVALMAAGIWLGVRSLSDDVSDRAGGETGAAVALIAGVALLFLARAVSQRRGWARSPVLVLQILFLPVGWGLLQSGKPLYGVPVVLVPLVTLGVLGAARALTPD
jgi:hypothetical protein